MRGRSVQLSFALLVATLAAGLICRFTPVGLPPSIVKYGGSTLWALALYWTISSLLPRTSPGSAALFALSIAVAVEIFKLVHTPWLEAFRRTLPGILLLGRFFSLQDIAAYGLAILAGALLDSRLRRRQDL